MSTNVPTLLWGPPGTGKTATITALAAGVGLPCETVIASVQEPSDFAGLPVVHDGAVNFAPPLWARRLADAGSGLLFLDEISTAPPAVQAALLRVVLDRTVGDLVLPDDVRVVAAANPPDVAANGWDLSAPLANRFLHLPWTVDAATVAAGISGRWPAVQPVAASPTTAQTARARAQVGAFLAARPNLVVAVPAEDALRGRAWPSPRSWDTLARLLAHAEAAGASPEAVALLVCGAVGEGAGGEFLAYVADRDLPDPEVLLADPAAALALLPERGDQLQAVCGAVATAAVARPTVERWDSAWTILAGVAETGAPDVAAAAVRLLAPHAPPGACLPPGLDAFTPVLQAAGLLPGQESGTGRNRRNGSRGRRR